jgi:leader peptidase (prepilin peptidase)/N-methyltransferase
LAWTAALPFVGMSLGEAGLHVLAGFAFGGGILGLSLILDRILGKDSLGGGDIKLFGVVGLYLGFVGTLFTVLLSAVLGLAFAAVLKLRGTADSAPGGKDKGSKAADGKAQTVKASSGKDKGGKAADGKAQADAAPDDDDAAQGHIPFGPSISLAAAFMMLFGQGLVAWYLGLLNI